MAQRGTVSVRLDADLVREAREILGARSNRQAVELAITIALAIREHQNGHEPKFIRSLGSDRFKI